MHGLKSRVKLRIFTDKRREVRRQPPLQASPSRCDGRRDDGGLYGVYGGGEVQDDGVSWTFLMLRKCRYVVMVQDSCRNAIICASKFKREDTMVKHIILWNFAKRTGCFRKNISGRKLMTNGESDIILV